MKWILQTLLLWSGNAPIITVPASEVGEVAEDPVKDEYTDEDTDVLVCIIQEVMDRLAKLNQELESMVCSTLEDTGSQEPLVDPNVNAWETRKAWEREFSLYPEASREEVYFQKLLHRFQEQVDQHTWNRDDKYMMDGLANIVVLHFRLDKQTERATKGPKL